MKKKDLSEVADLIFSFRPDDAYTKDEVIAQMRVWNAEVREFKQDEVCMKAGAPANHFLTLLRGTLVCRMPTPLGEDIVTRVVRPGEFVGSEAVFSHKEESCPVDVVAAEDSEVVFYDTKLVRSGRHDPVLAPLFDFLASLVCDDLKNARNHALVLGGMNIAERLRRYISLRLLKEETRQIAVPGREEDFAKYLCVNKCALSRVYGKLRKKGILSHQHNVLTLPDNLDSSASIGKDLRS